MDTKINSLKNTFIVTAASILLGVLYFFYISKVSFPPDTARVVPFIWLVGAGTGFRMGLSAFRSAAWYLRILFYALAILNIAFACIFALGALMGD